MISTHILDTSLGNPASGVAVSLFKQEGLQWKELKSSQTNSDGRCVFDIEKVAGTYKLVFEIADYFSKTKTESFFAEAPVIFKIQDVSRKYHVPLLLNPFGYSTYRGS